MIRSDSGSFFSYENEWCALVILTGRIVADDLAELLVSEFDAVTLAEYIAGEIVRVDDDGLDAGLFMYLVAHSDRILRQRNAELTVDREDIRVETVKAASPRPAKHS